MKKAAFIAVIVGTASIIAAGSVLAKGGPDGPGGPGMRMSFEEIDTDGNGEISQAEMDAMKGARFAKTDTNGDGVVSLEELTAQGVKNVAARAEKMLKMRDANGDGVLSQEELSKPRRAGQMFDRFDADGNGSISKEEFEEAGKHMRQRGKGHHRPGQQPDAETEQN
ncbi:EF-hand domain-containing protein [Parasedimentitalea psychrophila]|uniref:EF-hand domain-containing protein n=1 Tax=Parasedimentitalea psychrophila TaxID=2997337 RepID=A0A9Y2P1H1_9RHOB|nr:EF-hand domain-containing protein [Parasedimentitalea psychrophila]WIY25591.1 EF-hand domain-containing protein [Parasedimentitalea psychrophila]